MEVPGKGIRVNLADAVWQRAKHDYSEGVEIAFIGKVTAMRKSGQDDVVLLFTEEEWDAFVDGAEAGEFDV